jgi:alkylated DNA repair dioxygenase AlkB
VTDVATEPVRRGKHRLLDDATGFVEFTPDFMDAATAQSWFTWLHEHITWEGGRRLMYEREVDVPRLRAHYRSSDAQLPGPLNEALERVKTAIGAPFDSIGLNLYRDQHDSVVPHNDGLADLTRGQPTRRLLQVDMESGSLLLMSWATQLHYDHSIPKQRQAVGPRISLAFRVRGDQSE